MVKVSDIIDSIERYAPSRLQEEWDNTGLQVGHRDAPVSTVLTVVDVTPERVEEAVALGADMIVSHHPLIFKGLKSLTAENPVQRAVEMAIRHDIAVYSCHTALDNASEGVSVVMARMLGVTVQEPLVASAPGARTGTGVVGRLSAPISPIDFIHKAKEVFRSAVVRCSDPARCPSPIERIALCGGAGGSFIGEAERAGAQAYVTGDIRYHDFIDHANSLLIVDCGHYETEALTKTLFKEIINKDYPELPVYVSLNENNPVTYI